jgi:O-methyltransferase
MGAAFSLVSDLLAWGLTPAARRVRRERLTYLNPIKLWRIERAIREIGRAGIQGDFVEFGVALGGSGIILAQHAAAQGRSFHGFDVFGTIPPPTSPKDDDKSRRRYAEIEAGQSAGIGGTAYYGYRENLLAEVSRSFTRHGVTVDSRVVHLHKGLFEDTWPGTHIDRAALVHIDCDWYDPVAYCLEAVSRILKTGGLIVLDDYHDYGGARTAVDEFLGQHPEFSMESGLNPFLRKNTSTHPARRTAS